jgi:hypothetical protein
MSPTPVSTARRCPSVTFADSMDDLDVLRRSGMAELFDGIRDCACREPCRRP